MSVLIEAFTLIVRRQSLETAYPGGTEAFLSAVRALQRPPRFVCDSDPLLVNVSFSERIHLRAAVELLQNAGLGQRIDADAVDFVDVDQHAGPATPCAWLEWERFTDGVTVAWMAGKEPGALAAPKGWSPAPSPERALTGDAEAPENLFPLAREDGVETFLDLETGRQIVTPVDNAANLPAEQPEQDPIHEQLLRAIAEAGWNAYFTDAPSAMVDLRGDAALYTSRYYVAEELRTLVCNTRSPIIVPKRARRKVMEFITRANFGMMHGGFEMSLEYGTLFFRVSCGLQDGTLTSAMVTQMANAGVWSFDRYLPRMLEVVYGKRRVEEAVSEAEK